MPKTDNKPVTTTVRSCARCGEDHEKLTFQPFKRAVEPGSSEALTHWAMCPNHDEPILMYIATLTS
jgi:hypothetical protein